MLYTTQDDAFEAFCDELPSDDFDLLDASGFILDAFDGWLSANGHDFEVAS